MRDEMRAACHCCIRITKSVLDDFRSEKGGEVVREDFPYYTSKVKEISA